MMNEERWEKMEVDEGERREGRRERGEDRTKLGPLEQCSYSVASLAALMSGFSS
jgi:hypothetical protein